MRDQAVAWALESGAMPLALARHHAMRLGITACARMDASCVDGLCIAALYCTGRMRFVGGEKGTLVRVSMARNAAFSGMPPPAACVCCPLTVHGLHGYACIH